MAYPQISSTASHVLQNIIYNFQGTSWILLHVLDKSMSGLSIHKARKTLTPAVGASYIAHFIRVTSIKYDEKITQEHLRTPTNF